ncbi:hypothetical protein [Crassaminicella indica]|uniref:Transposase n=1 Tax=Crassaminicella indica TaxID=2855394 RepID=A0ABX8R8R4_9CLOT|nr:hypothetical protein [Crassaminicella indica]QXM05186.1 hypothetical protein KVH43_07210 [Crassaminicella indica]
MSSKREKLEVLKEAVEIESQLDMDISLKEKVIAMTLVASDKIVDREELEKIWEVVRMFKFIEFAEKKGMEKGIAQGIEKGIAQGIEKGIEKGKIDMIKKLLSLGANEDMLMEASGLSLEAIKKIKEEIDKEKH